MTLDFTYMVYVLVGCIAAFAIVRSKYVESAYYEIFFLMLCAAVGGGLSSLMSLGMGIVPIFVGAFTFLFLFRLWCNKRANLNNKEPKFDLACMILGVLFIGLATGDLDDYKITIDLMVLSGAMCALGTVSYFTRNEKQKAQESIAEKEVTQ